MDMTACKMAGTNSNKDMGPVSFLLVSFDKVRFYMQNTDIFDAGSIDRLKKRVAVFMTICSALAKQQKLNGRRSSSHSNALAV